MIENKGQFGFPGLEVKGITIHNTGNELSAAENYALMEHSSDSRGTHYFVDEFEVIQAMPLDWCVYHTGMAKDWACQHTIAIEICRSQSDLQTYLKAERKAVNLVKQLLRQYGLNKRAVYFHRDFNPKTYCPHRIFEEYTTKKDWKARYWR